MKVKCNVKLASTIIKRITICSFIWVLMEVFNILIESKEKNMGALVSVLIAVISLILKLLDEMIEYKPSDK
ncbi:hypothetical protein [Clostridium cadaveris]|uniref:hypothetical protein n=1 Tax=Clostridium cadaveris TaxID=1529 RepID=UPI003993DDFC